MHELSALKGLIRQVEETARSEGGSKVSTVRLRVSTMSGMDADHVRETWEIASPGTMCEGARLEIEEIPPRFRCSGCGQEFFLSKEVVGCPQCGAEQVRTVPEASLVLESFDIE